MLMQAKNAVGSNTPGAASSAADLAPSWRPKTLQNRGRNPKKSMLKNNTFSASILEGFGPRFGRVFGRFFGPKMHAKSDLKKSVRQAKSIGKTNTKSMSALLRQRLFRAKIAEKSHVCWDIDFKVVLEGFWNGFRRRKISIFAFFSIFFEAKFKGFLGRLKNRVLKVQHWKLTLFWPGPTECAEPGGEIERG